MTNQPTCKRCLLNDLDDKRLYNNILEYISALPGDEKVSPEEYAIRLDACKACDNLVNGLCALCGCFIEIRAALIKNHCAKSEGFW